MLLIGFDQKFSIFREIVNFYSVPKSRQCVSRSAKKAKWYDKTLLGRLQYSQKGASVHVKSTLDTRRYAKRSLAASVTAGFRRAVGQS